MTTFLFTLLLFVIVFWPAWAVNYFYHDDILFWAKFSSHFPVHFYQQFTGEIGRWANGWLLTVSGWGVNDIGDLRVLRVVMIVQLSISVVLLMRIWLRYIKDPLVAWLASVLIFTGPCFVIVITWAACLPLMTSVTCALLALTCVLNEQRLIKVLGIVLFLLAISLHQSVAMFYWVGVLVIFLFEQPKALKVAGLGFIAMGIYAILLCLTSGKGGTPEVASMYKLAVNNENLFEKMRWFVVEPWSNVVNGWNIFPRGPITGVVSALFLVAVFKLSKSFKWPILCFSGVSLLILLSFLPNLVAASHVAFYRCLGPLSAVVMVVFVAGLYQQKFFVRPVLVVLVLLGGFWAMNIAWDYRVKPSMTELVYMTQQVKQMTPQRYDHMQIERPFKRGVKGRYNEFNSINLRYPFNSFLTLRIIYHELGIVNQMPLYITSQPPGFAIDYLAFKAFKQGRLVREKGKGGQWEAMQSHLKQGSFGIFPFEDELYIFTSQANLFKQHAPWVIKGNDII